MKRPTCDEVQELLPGYADGAAGRAEALAIHRHLVGCPECRREAAEWQALNRLLERGLTAPEPVAQAEVEAAIRRVHEASPAWRLVPVRLRFWRSWSPMAAMAVAAVVLVLIGSYSPPMATAAPVLREWATSVMPASPRDVAGLLEVDGIDVRAWSETVRSLPQSTADRVTHEWDRGLRLSLDLGRRVPLVPLTIGAVALLFANVLFIRAVRGTLRPAQGG